MKSPIDQIMDEDNCENIVLYNENNEMMEFEQIAVIPLNYEVYVILRPVALMEGIGEDEALVFQIGNEEDTDCLMVVENDAIIDAVFEEYYKMLRESGVDV